MNAAELLALADRVEGLTGPDREVDALIHYRSAASGMSKFSKDCAPAYTASIDAAMSLVPEGWGYAAAANPGGERHHWGLWQYHGTLESEATAATPALALTAAALRACASRASPDRAETGTGSVSEANSTRSREAGGAPLPPPQSQEPTP